MKHPVSIENEYKKQYSLNIGRDYLSNIKGCSMLTGCAIMSVNR